MCRDLGRGFGECARMNGDGRMEDRGNTQNDRGIVGSDTNLMQPRVRMQVPGHN